MKDYSMLEEQRTRLKILGFVNTGVPVQVRPGAPNQITQFTAKPYLSWISASDTWLGNSFVIGPFDFGIPAETSGKNANYT